METYIRQYIEAHDTPLSLCLAGRRAHAARRRLFPQCRRNPEEIRQRQEDIENAFQTNGVLLNDEWGELFLENQFLIGVSIDGPRELHDAYRVDKGGQPTFDRVDARHRGSQAATEWSSTRLTTVHRANAGHPLRCIVFSGDNGSGFMQFIPIVERMAHQVTSDGLQPHLAGLSQVRRSVLQWSVEPRQFGRFLCAIFDEWVRKDVGGTFVQLFDVSLKCGRAWRRASASSGETCGAALAIEHSGDVYSCDHFVYPENRLGNIMESPLAVARWLRPAAAIRRRQGNDRFRAIAASATCASPATASVPSIASLTTPDGEPGLNYLCAGYKMYLPSRGPLYALHGCGACSAARAGQRDALGGRTRGRTQTGECGKARPQRSLSLWQREKIQALLREVSGVRATKGTGLSRMVWASVEGYGLQPVHAANITCAGFSP